MILAVFGVQLPSRADTPASSLPFYIHQGGVTHIGAVYIAATGVKMWSNGQDTFWEVVKRSSSIPGPIYLPLVNR